MLSLSKFLTVCPPEAVNYVQLNSSKSTVEPANLVQEYFHNQPNQENRKFTRFNQCGTEMENAMDMVVAVREHGT